MRFGAYLNTKGLEGSDVSFDVAAPRVLAALGMTSLPLAKIAHDARLSPANVERVVDRLVDAGFLTDDQGGYRLTEDGHYARALLA